MGKDLRKPKGLGRHLHYLTETVKHSGLTMHWHWMRDCGKPKVKEMLKERVMLN
jgi:hypothetical protein